MRRSTSRRCSSIRQTRDRSAHDPPGSAPFCRECESPMIGGTGARDMSMRTPAERRLAAQHAAALALADSDDLSDAAPRILQALCRSLGWAHGALWQVAANPGELWCVETWHEPGLSLAKFDSMSRGTK